MSRRTSKSVTALMVVIAAVLVTGCADARGEQALREIWAEQKDEAKLDEYKAVPDQVLASGDVLSVRVSYGESGAKQCQVPNLLSFSLD